MGDIKKLAKSTVVYFIGNVLSKVIVLFLVPLYTKYISSADYGYYDAAVAILTFFQSVLFLDIGSTIMRFMFENAKNKSKAICSGSIIFSISVVVYLLIGVFTGIFANVQYVWYLFAYGIITITNTVLSFICRGNGNGSYYAMTGVVATIINVSLNIILIVVVRMDYQSLYISSIVSTGIQAILLEIKNKDYRHIKKLNFDVFLFKDMLKYALPLSVNSAAFWGLTSLNKILVTILLGTAANGYLAMANKFTGAVYLLSTCFQLAWQELAFSKKNSLDPETGAYYGSAFKLLLKIVLIGLALILPAIKLLLTVFPSFIDPSYSTAISLIPLAMAGAVMSVVSSFLGSIFGGIKKTNIIFTSTLAGAAVNAGLCVGLIYAGVGIESANIGFLAGFIINTIIRAMYLKKYIGMKTNYLYFIVYVPIFAVIALVFLKGAWYYNVLVFLAVLAAGIFILKKEIKTVFTPLLKKFRSKKGGNSFNEDINHDVQIDCDAGYKETQNNDVEHDCCGGNMTKIEDIQKCLKNMLSAFHNFCEKNDLTYYVIGGTLLGAVRHKGFIPWDDDIDIGMPWKDYIKLQELCHSIKKYEFVSRKSTAGFPYGFVKMYNPDTTLVEKFELDVDNCAVGGVFVDVFPLVGMGDTYKNAEKHMKLISHWRTILSINVTQGKMRTSVKQLAAKFIRLLPENLIWNKLDKMLVKYDYDKSLYIANFYGTYKTKEVADKVWFGKPRLYDFEDIKVYGPEMADEYLTRVYGDYMTLPPVEKRHVHTFAYCNLNLAYKDYIKENKQKNE